MGGEGRVDEEDGEEIWHEHEIKLPMDPERAFPGLPFVSNVIGLAAGEEKEFSFSFPDDYDDDSLIGKPAKFNVKVDKVQSRELPELTDELAQEEGEYETVEDLRATLRDELFERARRDSRATMLDEFVDDMMTDAEIVYPPAAVESELDNMLGSMKEQIERSGWQWADYLKLQGESEESLRQEWQDGAVRRIERGLVLRQFVMEEQLSVESVEIDSAVDQRLESYEADDELREQLRKMFTDGQGLEILSNDILLEKTYDRVEAIETGNAPDLDAIDSDDASTEEEE
jgi:trigger factor